MNSQDDQERKKQVIRFFDYAENPIKEWIAKQLQREPEQIFDKYSNESEVISINVMGEQYLVYLSTDPPLTEYMKKQHRPPNQKDEPALPDVKSYTAFILPEQPINNKDQNDYYKLYRACSTMQDAVYSVYPFIVKTLFQTAPIYGNNSKVNSVDNSPAESKVENPFDDVIPLYDEQDKCFRFIMINKFHYMKEQASYQVVECSKQLARIAEGIKHPQFNPENLPKLEENKQKLLKLREEQMLKHNSILQETIDAQQVICNESNKNFGQNKLYITLEHNKISNEEQMMSRLPKLGDKYEDLDDDNLIDKFKKEMNVTD